MLARIEKIKRLGLVFDDFSWTVPALAFKQTNLIYGWNGCGKTTLTRLFDHIANASGDCEYQLENADGATFTHTDAYPFAIRVFNQDYIASNVRILEGCANTISVLLGEENGELAAQIEADERLLNGDPADPTKIGLVQELHGFTEKRIRKERGNETEFTNVARTIGAATVGASTASRNYRAPDAKRDFDRLTEKSVLTESDLALETAVLKQEVLPTLDVIEPPQLTSGLEARAILPTLAAALEDAAELAGATVVTEVIARLRDNPDIAQWVEVGAKLHADHNSSHCEYCGAVVSEERIGQLAGHFSDADRALRARIDVVLADLRLIYAALNRFAVHDPARLYREMQGAYVAALRRHEEARAMLRDKVAAVGEALAAKKLDTGAPLDLDVNAPSHSFTEALAALNDVVKAHNKKTNAFEKVKSAALARVRNHYLSTVYDEVVRRRREIEELIPDLERRRAQIDEVKQRISVARAAISSAHRACGDLNQALTSFLGRAELTFEPDEQEVDGARRVVGYRIMRGTEPAVLLSEGEKTALAFVYFVVHLNDGQFRKADGIIVIDDPISSMDSNSVYQAFAFLKGAVKDAKQVFILTHNFEFLKLLLNWRLRAGNRTSHLMVKNVMRDGKRRAILDEMDKELKTYASEYHYLFKRLKEMEAEQDGTIAAAYPVPNMARKLWEAFLVYRVPNGQQPYQKTEFLKENGFDAQKLDAIYKFTNDQSHITGGGFDPSLVPEARNAIANVFEMMRALAPDHCEVLEASVSA